MRSPALAIAECVVHQRLHHGENPPQITFTAMFEQWLLAYWDYTNRQGAIDIARSAAAEVTAPRSTLPPITGDELKP
jgi:hypothetical protein